MRDFVSILFYCMAKKTNKKKGTTPVYCRITVRSTRCEFSTGVYIKKEHLQNGAILPLNEMLIDQQKQLDIIKIKLNKIETDIRIKEGFLSAERIKEIYQNGFSTKSSFSEVAEEFLMKKKKTVGLDIVQKSYRRYERTVEQINEFIKHQYKQNSYPMAEIKAAFADDFYLYCRTEKKHDVLHIRRAITILKAIINYAVVNDYAENNYLVTYSIKTKVKSKPIEFLSVEQLRIIKQTKFESMALNYTRDCFLFQCYTGLAHVDLGKFSMQNITSDAHGQKWIIVHREKTTSKSTIPLLPEAGEIINKYEDLTHRVDTKIQNKGVLPVYVNQVYNRLLKQIGLICNLPIDVMKSHVARKTFAMTILNSGVSLESVSKMLGHTKLEITQKHYAFVDTKRIAKEMQNFSFTNS